jgi:hypothetical protein
VEMLTSSLLYQINEPTKHVALEWVEWTELWAMIKADIEGGGEADESGQRMSFFATMKNMVLKYPGRCDPSCLYKRTVKQTLLELIWSLVTRCLPSNV